MVRNLSRRSKLRLTDSIYLLEIIGGGWSTGSKMFAARATLDRVASRGIVVVSINYRLAPERPFPAQLLDCRRALTFVKRNCRKWNGDPDKVFVCGESAGGHLTALIGTTAHGAESQVAGAIPLYGVFDWTDTDGHLAALHPPLIEGTTGTMRQFIERVVMQKPFRENRFEYELASPIFYVREALKQYQDPKFCPFMVVHGTHDALAAYNDSLTFFNELQKVRQKFHNQTMDVFISVTGGHHAFGYIVSPRAMALADGIVDFIYHYARTADIIVD